MALFELLRRGLLNHHRRLAHHTATASLAEESRGLAGALALLELLCCGLPNHHRRLTHHTAAAGLVEELRGLVEALALHESVLMIGFSLGFVEDLWSGIYGFWFDDWVLFCF